MHKFYWKIFIWFWLAMTLTIVATALSSSEVVKQSTNNSKETIFMETVVSAASVMVQSLHFDEFDQWSDVLSQKNNIRLMLYDNTTDRLLPSLHNNLITPNILIALKSHAKRNSKFQLSPFLVSAPIEANNGHSYRILTKPPARIISHYNFNWPNIIVRFIVAILIGGFVCYLLSLYLLRPIRVLRRATRSLARGQLDTRIKNELENRKDEVGDLATEFDDMVEKLQSLIKTREQLIQDISHELRSPLARLSIALEIAKDKDTQAAPELERITKESERLNELIGKILSLASLSVGEIQVQFAKLNLTHMLKQIVDDANFEQQCQAVVINFDSDNDITLAASEVILRSALENIIRNALKYSPKGQPIQVTVKTHGKSIDIMFRDFGPGIPEDKLHYIFEPFYRVDSSRTTKTGGYGLGLAIVKKAINVHKGTVSAENVDPGLAITIKLPKP